MGTPRLAVPRSLRGAAAASRPASAVRPSPLSSLVICRHCRRSRLDPPRAYYSSSSSSSSSLSSALPQPRAAGVAALASRRVISVAGPDAAKYLQGVITSNILRLQQGGDGGPAPSGLYSGFLSAQGRVLHDVFVYRDTLGVGGQSSLGGVGGSAEAFLIEVDAGEAATLAQHIKRYKLRAKFAVRLLDAGELTVWHGWGLPAGVGLPGGLPDGQQQSDDAVIALHDTRAPGLGWRFVARSPPPPLLELGGADHLGLAAADESAYRVHRYLLGVAEGQREILRGQALPLESNMDLMGAVDFHKGCYVGQELTIRTRHRGVVRKRILPCIVYGEGDEQQQQPGQWSAAGGEDAQPPTLASAFSAAGPAADIPAEASIGRAGKKGRSAGKWLSGVGNLGLALCRLETMTDVVLPGEAAAAAATAAATFDPASEFVLNVADKGESEGAASGPAPVVKIKAFVPDWLRRGLAPDASH